MDLLQTLQGSDEEETDTKDILHDHGILATKVIESDEEQIVEHHLSPDAVVDESNENVQYAIRSTTDGVVSYRVLHVDDSSNVPQLVTTATNLSSPNVQLLTNNLGGQLYVLQNEVFTSPSSNRTITPRSSLSETNSTTNVKRRDERRRATHNEVERRRRDKINNWITKLSKIIPENSGADAKSNGHYDGQSKGGILAKACEYILRLREVEQKAETTMKDNLKLQKNVEMLQQRNALLNTENKKMRDLLTRHGVDIQASGISLSLS